jgi:hypothetical protein
VGDVRHEGLDGELRPRDVHAGQPGGEH